MPSTTPLFTADYLIQAAVILAVAGATTETAHGSPRAYWEIAPPGTPRPYLVAQLQDDIRSDTQIGRSGVTTQVLLIGLGDTLQAAREILGNAAAVILFATIPSHDVSVTYRASPRIPFDGAIYRVAHLYRITVRAV